MNYTEKLTHASHLSNTEIKKEYEKASAASSAHADKMIAAGRGNERPSDYTKKDDALSREGSELLDKHSALRHEAEMRGGPGAHPTRLGSGLAGKK